jgi:hypothetical protein
MRSRNAVVTLARSWLGKNEEDGSYKSIIDIYNSYTGKFPRGIKMAYGWAWCAATWSALAIRLGYTDIMPVEISCYYLIEAAKKMDIWVENDGYTPKPADAVLYDWEDSGRGDNTGVPDHIGTVESVNTAAGTFTVIEGNYSDAVKRRTMKINGRYIRGFICPRYDTDGTAPGGYDAAKKSVAEVAREVISGAWGNGNERVTALKNAGYNFSEVQEKVNALLKNSDVTKIAKEVIAGKWGNGRERRKKLEAAGFDYEAVQAKVNDMLK